MLSICIWHALVGALGLYLVPKQNISLIRLVAVVTALFGLVFSIYLYLSYDQTINQLQFIEKLPWIGGINAEYFLAVDGISVSLILLTCLTTLIICLMGGSLVRQNLRDYLAIFLIMQSMVIGVFCAQDALLFFLFWEGSLIPMYLCIGIWGSKNRSFAARKFFIYTFLGSTLLLIAVLFLGIKAQSFNLANIAGLSLDLDTQLWLFGAFLLAFAIKVPMFPVHTWLPDAHTEAPTGGSVLLAALLLKVGAYGFVRFSLPITPDASQYMAIPMIVLSLIAIVYVGFIALAQSDMKRLIAYSSVAHMGFVTLGMFGIYLIPKELAVMTFSGAMIQMIAHAFGSGAMFLAFGMMYERLKTRNIDDMGGVATIMPYLASFFVVFSMANIGVPGTSGFIGELLILVSFLKHQPWISAIAGLTLIISASYTLWMVRRVFYGPVNPNMPLAYDVTTHETGVLSIFVACIFLLGLYPKPLGDLLLTSSEMVIASALHSKTGAKS